MNREEFLKEYQDYPIEDLELICSTQEDLYSKEELQIICELIEKKQKEEEEELQKLILEKLPDEISCNKCDGINRFENDICQFCGNKLDKRKYYDLEYYDEISEETETESSEEETGYTFQYVISFLIPIIGFILGAILLSKDSDEEKNVGKQCIIIGIVSVVLSAIVSTIAFHMI